jgi:hypothetical protein
LHKLAVGATEKAPPSDEPQAGCVPVEQLTLVPAEHVHVHGFEPDNTEGVPPEHNESFDGATE